MPVLNGPLGSGYGTCSRAVDAGTPETKAPGGAPVTGAPPSGRCPWVSPVVATARAGVTGPRGCHAAGKDRAGCSAPLFRNQDRGHRGSPGGPRRFPGFAAIPRGRRENGRPGRPGGTRAPWGGMWMEGETPGLPRKVWGLRGSRASRGRRRPPTPPPRLRRASPRSSGCAFRRRRG